MLCCVGMWHGWHLVLGPCSTRIRCIHATYQHNTTLHRLACEKSCILIIDTPSAVWCAAPHAHIRHYSPQSATEFTKLQAHSAALVQPCSVVLYRSADAGTGLPTPLKQPCQCLNPSTTSGHPTKAQALEHQELPTKISKPHKRAAQRHLGRHGHVRRDERPPPLQLLHQERDALLLVPAQERAVAQVGRDGVQGLAVTRGLLFRTRVHAMCDACLGHVWLFRS